LATHFVTGGTGLVGQALIMQLRAQGDSVAALGRTPAALHRLADLGAEPVPGDLLTPGAWQYDAADAEIVWHLGLPRTRTPLRSGRVRKEARLAWRAADHLIADRDRTRPVVSASHVLAWGNHGPGPIDETTTAAPVAMGHWALAAEEALAATPLRAVRLGWTYGPDGMFAELVAAIRRGQFRIVGPGQNLLPLISADDAARALRAAAGGPPGVYAATEPDPPTQEQMVHHICAQVGSRRPDRLTPRMAAFAMGGEMVDALSSSLEVRSTRLRDLGWTPEHGWRDVLVEVSRPGARAV
jgi:nucleoside-diphosphate-sugar epimerase